MHLDVWRGENSPVAYERLLIIGKARTLANANRFNRSTISVPAARIHTAAREYIHFSVPVLMHSVYGKTLHL